MDCQYCGEKFDTEKSYLKHNCKEKRMFYKHTREKLKNNHKDELQKLYIDDGLSPNEIALIFNTTRTNIEKVLKELSILQSLSDRFKNKANKVRRLEKSKNTCLKNHGVTNIGYTLKHGRSKLNKVPYKKIEYLTGNEYETYVQKVQYYTKQALKIKDKPKYCEYTGIMFGDELYDEINPNDPIKRSVDHKIPVVIGYLNQIPPERIGSIENLAYVIRYVNSIKGNTLYESFIPTALKIREIFKNENYICK